MSIRFVSEKSKTSKATEGSNIILATGERGKVLQKLNGGWWNVEIYSDSENVVVRTAKLRTKGFTMASKNSFQTEDPKIVTPSIAVVPDLLLKLDLPQIIPTIEPPMLHRQVKKWIIFSDLHVKGSSIDNCEQVLHEVHLAAVARQAGIIFLGDFWHVRGAINVDLLNRVLLSLKQWTQPVIMIPGDR